MTERIIMDSLTYIWSNPQKVPELDFVAKRAAFSPSHFQKVFSKYTGESFHTHVHRIKLEQAAVWLKFSKTPIADIALETGYGSREGFTRAFKLHFKTTPGVFRKNAKEKSKMLIMKNGYHVMSIPIKIVKEPSVKVAFIRQYGDYMKVPFTWAKLGKWAKKNDILQKNSFCIGINYDDPAITPSKHLRYDACITIDDIDTYQEKNTIFTQELPGGWFAETEFEGTAFEEDEMWDYLAYCWLPKSKYFLRDFRCRSIYSTDSIPSNNIEAMLLLNKKYKAKLKIPISTSLTDGFLQIFPFS